MENSLCYNLSMQIPLLQTKAWQKFQNSLKKTAFFTQTPDFSYLAILESTPIGNYLFLPYGPVAKTPANFKKALHNLQSLAQAKKAFFIRLEPQNLSLLPLLQSNPKFHKTININPADTWVLNLQSTPEKIISNFSQGTRTRYHNIKKRGLTITTSKNPNDIKYLIKLQSKLAKSKNFHIFSEDYLKTELSQTFATLFLVKYSLVSTFTPRIQPQPDEVVAISLFFDDQTTRYYMQSASALQYKQLPSTVALLTSAIFDAKQKGLKNFDFWGIAPENAPQNHPWTGFTTFKKSFGGQSVHYCGTYDYVLNSKKYTFYNLLRQTNRFIRKL